MANIDLPRLHRASLALTGYINDSDEEASGLSLRHDNSSVRQARVRNPITSLHVRIMCIPAFYYFNH